MTIFPTHKTELKTKLPRHEVLKRLENNEFYAIGYCYKLEKSDADYTLKPQRDTTVYRNPKSSTPPIMAMSIEQKRDNTEVDLKFFPLRREIAITAIGITLVMLMQIAVLIISITHNNISFNSFIPSMVGIIVYLLGLLKFSFEVIHIRKQIVEALEAEIHEVTEDEMSKLQKWYEKKR